MVIDNPLYCEYTSATGLQALKRLIADGVLSFVSAD